MRSTKFDSDKTIEAIAYIANNLPEENQSTYFVVKMFYFADKLHLERYGRQITNDSYRAMKNGPVPSGAYDTIKSVRSGQSGILGDHASNVFVVYADDRIASISELNLDLFSDSELECIDDAIANYGHYPFGELMRLSHDDAWDAADLNDSMDILEIAKTLPNADKVIAHLTNPYPD